MTPLDIQRLADRRAIDRDAQRASGGVLENFPWGIRPVLYEGSVMDTPVLAERRQLLDPVYGMMPVAGIFAGTGAKTANKLALQKAQEMTAKSANRDKVWKETGWFKDVDGQWKYEIDDSGMRYDPHSLKVHKDVNDQWRYESGDMGEALYHPQLAKAYPHTNKIHISDFPWKGKDLRRGSYERSTINGEPMFGSGERISLWETPKKRIAFGKIPDQKGKDLRWEDPGKSSTLTHELQHAIQEKEGFARGGSAFDPGIQQSYWNKYASDYRAGGGPELLAKSDQLSRVMRDLRHVDHINDLRNITQPRQLFNSMQFYEHSRTLRNALGPTPKRGPKYKKWSQDAGKMLADILVGKRQNSNIDKLMTQDRATIKKMLRNAEAREVRLNKRGAMEMRRVRKKMDETDPHNYPWDLERLYKGYRNLAGEAEARNVQTRMDFTPAERMAKPPWTTLDVPEDELLVRGVLGGK